MMKTIISIVWLWLFLLLIITCSTEKQDGGQQSFVETRNPEEAGFDASRLQRVDTFIQSYISRDNLPNLLGSAGSFRWAGMYSTDYLIDPEEDLIILTFTNVYNNVYFDEFTHKFRNLVYQALE